MMTPPRTWLEKADQYLASAQLLLDNGYYESAVSRAYYAARYTAIHLFLVRKAGWQPKWLHDSIALKMIEQARNLSWLRTIVMSGQRDFAGSWSQLLDYRSRADYEVGKINERIAQRSITFVQALVQAVKENLP